VQEFRITGGKENLLVEDLPYSVLFAAIDE